MNCVVTLAIRKPDGSALSGVSVTARVASASTSVNTDSSGIATWSIASGSKVKFLCSAVSSLHGLTVKVPAKDAFSVGIFMADALAEAEVNENELTADELAAIQGAADPDAENPFATMADVGGGGYAPLSTTNTVNMNTGTPTTLYTVPADNIAIITNVVIRGSSVSLTTASISFGWNDADYNNVIANATHTELTGATKAKVVHPDATSIRGAAADVFKVKANTLQGEAATVSIDVFGYLIGV